MKDGLSFSYVQTSLSALEFLSSNLEELARISVSFIFLLRAGKRSLLPREEGQRCCSS